MLGETEAEFKPRIKAGSELPIGCMPELLLSIVGEVFLTEDSEKLGDHFIYRCLHRVWPPASSLREYVHILLSSCIFFLIGGFLDLVITCLQMKAFQKKKRKKTSFPPISAGNMHKKTRDIFICIFLVSSFQQWPIMSTTSVNRCCRNCFREKFTSGAHGESGHRPRHLVLAAAVRLLEVCGGESFLFFSSGKSC